MLHYLNAAAYLSAPVSHDLGQPAAEPTNGGPPNSATAAAGNGPTDNPRYRTDLVVAGVDGSGGARKAAHWAAAEAVRRHGALRLIHAYSLAPAGYSGYNPYPATLLAELRDEGEDLLPFQIPSP